MTRVGLGAAILLLALPLLAWPPRPGEGGLLLFWRALLTGAAFWIGVGYILSTLRIFEPVTLVLAAAGGLAVAIGRFGRRPGVAQRRARDQRMSGLLGALDGTLGEAWSVLGPVVGQAVHRASAAIGRQLRDPYTLGAVAVMAISAGLRLWGPLHQVAPGSSDGYVHLLWTKEFMVGRPFYGGVYPEGMHAIAASVASVFFIDPLNVLRFAGPLFGFLMVLSVYTLTLEVTGSRLGAIVAAAIFGLGTASPLPEQAWRQINDLPQEASAAFFGVGIALALRYLRSAQSEDLWLYGVCVVVELWIHPYAPVFQMVVVGCLVLGQWAARGVGDKSARRVMVVSIVAGVLGLVPLGIGLAAGIPFFHGGVAFALQSVTATTVTAAGPWAALVAAPLYVKVGLPLGLALCTVGLRGDPRRRQRSLGLGLGMVVLWLLYVAHSLGLPSLADAYRVGEFYSMMLCSAGAALFFSGAWGQAAHAPGGLLLAGLLVIPGLVLWPPKAPVPLRYEPVGAGHAYLKISERFTPLSWTIISPVQQYSEVIGRGYHFELATFLADYPLTRAAQASFQLTTAMKTPAVFIYAQTKPIPGANVQQEQEITAWCQAYAQAHPGTMKVFYRAPGFEVFAVGA